MEPRKIVRVHTHTLAPVDPQITVIICPNQHLTGINFYPPSENDYTTFVLGKEICQENYTDTITLMCAAAFT